MLEKKSSWLLAVAACAVALQGDAQPPADIHEQALELARQQQELAREQEALNREYRQLQADFVREHAWRQREFASELSRVKALSAAENVELQQQMVQAREQLARAVGDVARASAKLAQPAQYRMRGMPFVFAGGQAVLGLSIEDSDFGVFVTGVTPNGPAATAGVEVGDTIVSINDVELARLAGTRSPTAALLGQIGMVAPGDDVKLRILRGGDYRDVVVKAGEGSLRKPFVFTGNRPVVRLNSWGAWMVNGQWSDIELVSLTPALGEYFGVTEGLLVVRAGRASELGFRDGDVIIDI
ncbi:MAG TPA: PDZ domain-containing protein, partial [Gammaproteobacteria bacterium]|nr:PDZ domain-containing protein [Gammaproteobacteria bacterium]